MAASTRALLAVAMAVAIASAALETAAHGASYTVGAPAGSWDLRTNYTLWSSGVTFVAGDQLVFKYPRAAHDVVEVSRADHDACSNASPINTFSTGDDVVALPAGGVTRYFICGVPGHCDAGMKLAVRVLQAASSAPPTSAAAPRAALPPMSAAGAPTAAAMPPASSPAAPAGVDRSVVEIVLSAVVATLTALIC